VGGQAVGGHLTGDRPPPWNLCVNLWKKPLCGWRLRELSFKPKTVAWQEFLPIAPFGMLPFLGYMPNGAAAHNPF